MIDSVGLNALPKGKRCHLGQWPLWCEWTETFGAERLTGTLLDRLTDPVNIT